MAKVKYKSAGRSFYSPDNDNFRAMQEKPRFRVLEGSKDWRNLFSEENTRVRPRSLKIPTAKPDQLLQRAMDTAKAAAKRRNVQPWANYEFDVRHASQRTAGAGLMLPQLGFGVFVGMHQLLWTRLFDRMAQRVSSSWIEMICGVPNGLEVVGLSALCGPSGTAYTINQATKASAQWEYAAIAPLGPPTYPAGLFSWKVWGRAKLKALAPAISRFPYHPTRITPTFYPFDLIEVMPWIDPLSLPYGRTSPTPLPNPWKIQPRMNPYRATHEQPGFRWGKARGVRPRPLRVGGGEPAAPTPIRVPTVQPVVRPVDVPTAINTPPVVRPPRPEDRPPKKGVKERKGKVGKTYWRMLQMYGAYTEMKDMVQYVYEALPQKRKRELYDRLGRQPNAAEQFMAVYSNAHEIRLGRAIENIAFGNMQDWLFSMYSKPTDKLIQKLVPNFEERMLLRALGNHLAVQSDARDPVAEYLREHFKRVRQGARPFFDAIDNRN